MPLTELRTQAVKPWRWAAHLYPSQNLAAQLESHQASPWPCPAPCYLSPVPLPLYVVCTFYRVTSPIPFPWLALEKWWKRQLTISKRVHGACGPHVAGSEEAPGNQDAWSVVVVTCLQLPFLLEALGTYGGPTFPLRLSYCTHICPTRPGGAQVIMSTKIVAIWVKCMFCALLELGSPTSRQLTSTTLHNTSQQDLAAGQSTGQRLQVIAVHRVLSR